MYRIVGFVALSYGLYRIGWIVLLDWIVSAGLAGLESAGLDWIISYQLDQDTSVFIHGLVTTRMGRMDWMGRWWEWGGTDGR